MAVTPQDNLARVFGGILQVITDIALHGRIKGGLYWVNNFRVVKTYLADGDDERKEPGNVQTVNPS